MTTFLFDDFANNPTTNLASPGIDSSVTTATVNSSSGFPPAPFRVVIDTEIIRVTNVSGTTWTIARGMEGTTAAAHSTGAPVTQVLTRDNFYNTTIDPGVFGARFSIASGNPNPTSASGSTFYLVPTQSDRVALQDGYGNWRLFSCTPNPTGSASSLSSGGLADVFVGVQRSGGLEPQVTFLMLPWTGQNRATGLVLLDGVWVLSGLPINRYIGTVNFDGGTSGQVTDTPAKRNLWNYYNRMPRSLVKQADFDINVPSSGGWNKVASTGNRVDFVIGLPQALVNMHGQVSVCASGGTGGPNFFSGLPPWAPTDFYQLGIGVDVTGANSAKLAGSAIPSGPAMAMVGTFHEDVPGSGSHFWQLIHQVGTTVSVAVLGSGPNYMGGLAGSIMG